MKRLKPPARFALYIRAEVLEDLEYRKIYQVLADRAADREGYLRVIDESGEDYLYPAEYFVPIKLPAPVAQALERPSSPALGSPAGARRRTVKMRLRAVRG